MSDLVGNPEDRFSRVAAHMVSGLYSTAKVVKIDLMSTFRQTLFTELFHLNK